MRILFTAVAVAALLATGLVHGYWTGRFDYAEGVAAAVERVEQTALDLPNWKGVALDVQTSANSSTAHHLFRRYVHRQTGREVNVLLVCGRPGPVSIHTPDACYGASGFQVATPVKKAWPIGENTAEFWSSRMVKKRPTEEVQLRVFWSWNAGTGWTASDNARMDFVRSPLLYKLYLIHDRAQEGSVTTDDPCVALMRELTPELDKSLFSQP